MGLSVADLCCFRAGRPVLAGLGFALADGETLVVRGPNGVGKSTLLRALAGLLPAAGRIALDGAAIGGDRDRIAELVAYCGHADALKPQLSVAENLRFWSGLLGGAGIDLALAAFGLEAIADRPLHVCSAGQKRRAGLARLLVAPRRLWLLDEPTVALDAAAVGLLLAALRRHAEAGGLAVVATHQPLDLPRTRELVLALAGETSRAADVAAAADPFLAGAWE